MGVEAEALRELIDLSEVLSERFHPDLGCLGSSERACRYESFMQTNRIEPTSPEEKRRELLQRQTNMIVTC